MRGQFVGLRPGIDRGALDFLPVAGRERHGSSAISAVAFLSGIGTVSRDTKRSCRVSPALSGARSDAVEKGLGLAGFEPMDAALHLLQRPTPDHLVRSRHGLLRLTTLPPAAPAAQVFPAPFAGAGNATTRPLGC